MESAAQNVLMDFCASWCDACQVIWALTEDVGDYYGGELLVRHVDVDARPELASRYQVRSVPTLLLLRGGEVVARFVGIPTRDKICAAVDALLERG